MEPKGTVKPYYKLGLPEVFTFLEQKLCMHSWDKVGSRSVGKNFNI